MSTLAEIEAAVEKLPRAEQEILRAHLAERLGNPVPTGAERLDALDALQARLALDAAGSRDWLAAVQDARR